MEARAWLNMLSSPGIPERRSLWSALNAPFSPLFPPLITPQSFVPKDLIKENLLMFSSVEEIKLQNNKDIQLTGVGLWNDSFRIH
jgi:hypothetical protein